MIPRPGVGAPMRIAVFPGAAVPSFHALVGFDDFLEPQHVAEARVYRLSLLPWDPWKLFCLTHTWRRSTIAE